MDDEDEYRLAKIAVRLLRARRRRIQRRREIASVLKPILNPDLDVEFSASNPNGAGVCEKSQMDHQGEG